MSLNTDWPAKVAGARERLRLTTRQLAKRLGTSSYQLGAVERGQLLPDGKLERALSEACAPGQLPLSGD